MVSGPIPPYSNPAIEPQFFKPSRFVITAVVLGETTTITTDEDHNYVIGQECRLLFPQGYGCTQLSEKKGFVISIPSADQVVLTINSQNVNDFVDISSSQQPQILAIGDVNTGQINNNGLSSNLNYIDGAFSNISPA